MADHGYDVADPRDVEPVFGDLAEFDALLAEAHALGIRVTIDLVPNHSSRPARAGSRRRWPPAPGSPERARYLFRDGRGPDGERAAEQLAVGVRRAGVDPGARRPVVPAPVRARAARPGLHQPRGARRPRGDDAVLAGPRRRRLPDRRRARHGQARRAAGHGADGGHRAARRPRPRRPALRPGRRARGAPADPGGARRVPGPDGRRRGVGGRRRAAGAATSRAGRAAAGLQLPAADRRVGRRRRCATRSTTRWPRSAGTPAPACWVLSNHDVPPARHPLRRRRRSASAGPGRPRCCSWPCPARSTSTTATSSACRTSTCPTRCCRTRSGSAPAAPSAAGTAAGCRCRGRAPSRRTASRPRRDTWLPMPAGWARADRRGAGGRPRRCCRCTGRRWRCGASSAAFGGEGLEWLQRTGRLPGVPPPGGLVCLVNLSGAPVPLPEGARAAGQRRRRRRRHAARRRGGLAARLTGRRPVDRGVAERGSGRLSGDQRRRPRGGADQPFQEDSWPPLRCPRCRRARSFSPTSCPPSARGTPSSWRSACCSPPRWPRCRCRSRLAGADHRPDARGRADGRGPRPGARHRVQVVYIAAALVGLPFYSEASGGVDVVFGATGGYVDRLHPGRVPDRPGRHARRGPEPAEGRAAVHRRPGRRSSRSACRGWPSRPG